MEPTPFEIAEEARKDRESRIRGLAIEDAADWLRDATPGDIAAALSPDEGLGPDGALINAMGKSWVAQHFGVDEGSTDFDAACAVYREAYLDVVERSTKGQEVI